MKRNKTVIASIACGLLCAFCVLAYTTSVQEEAEEARAEVLARYGGDQVEVVVAKEDIVAGQTVDASAIEKRLWIVDLLPDGAVSNSDQVVGKKASSTVLAGEVLSSRRFEGLDVSLDIPEGMTAVSVPAQNVQAVGGAVSSGLHVDAYSTGGTSTNLIASNVLVLSTNASGKDEASGVEVAWITLAVEPKSVQELVAAAQKTELYFSLPSLDKSEGSKDSSAENHKEGDKS